MLGRDVTGRIWVGKQENTQYTLSIWKDDGMVAVRSWNFIPTRVMFDFLGNSVILFRSETDGLLMSLENQEIRE